jgi:hypothetical protein
MVEDEGDDTPPHPQAEEGKYRGILMQAVGFDFRPREKIGVSGVSPDQVKPLNRPQGRAERRCFV